MSKQIKTFKPELECLTITKFTKLLQDNFETFGTRFIIKCSPNYYERFLSDHLTLCLYDRSYQLCHNGKFTSPYALKFEICFNQGSYSTIEYIDSLVDKIIIEEQ